MCARHKPRRMYVDACELLVCDIRKRVMLAADSGQLSVQQLAGGCVATGSGEARCRVRGLRLSPMLCAQECLPPRRHALRRFLPHARGFGQRSPGQLWPALLLLARLEAVAARGLHHPRERR